MRTAYNRPQYEIIAMFENRAYRRATRVDHYNFLNADNNEISTNTTPTLRSSLYDAGNTA